MSVNLLLTCEQVFEFTKKKRENTILLCVIWILAELTNMQWFQIIRNNFSPNIFLSKREKHRQSCGREEQWMNEYNAWKKKDKIDNHEENRLLDPKGEKTTQLCSFRQKREADYAPTSNQTWEDRSKTCKCDYL